MEPFNSRPHAEVDCIACIIARNKRLSTHDLTQRSTILLKAGAFDQSFQLTTSRRGRRMTNMTLFGNGSFQLTTSRRGRLDFRVVDIEHQVLSTHDLTQRSTLAGGEIHHKAVLSTHDLTQRSTRRRRHNDKNTVLSTHDLTQRSTGERVPSVRSLSFQLTTSRRGRPHPISLYPLAIIFQLTTSRRGRQGHVLQKTVRF